MTATMTERVTSHQIPQRFILKNCEKFHSKYFENLFMLYYTTYSIITN